jgi:hypothetical protein
MTQKNLKIIQAAGRVGAASRRCRRSGSRVAWPPPLRAAGRMGAASLRCRWSGSRVAWLSPPPRRPAAAPPPPAAALASVPSPRFPFTPLIHLSSLFLSTHARRSPPSSGAVVDGLLYIAQIIHTIRFAYCFSSFAHYFTYFCIVFAC